MEHTKRLPISARLTVGGSWRHLPQPALSHCTQSAVPFLLVFDGFAARSSLLRAPSTIRGTSLEVSPSSNEMSMVVPSALATVPAYQTMIGNRISRRSPTLYACATGGWLVSSLSESRSIHSSKRLRHPT